MEVEGAPGPASFEGQSGGILEMVEGLGEKFEEERDTLQKEEMNEKHAHDMMAADLNDQIESEKNSGKKAATKAQRESDKAAAEGELADTTNGLKEEASEEAEHKGFCDTEMGTNKVTRDSK